MNGLAHATIATRLRRSAEAFRACVRVLSLLTRLLPDTDEGDAMQADASALERDFNGAVMLQGAALEDRVRDLESRVGHLERALEAFDARIPMGWFRQHFDATQTSSVTLADYAALLGRFLGDGPLRLDRIQYLLTRVISFFVAPHDSTPERRRMLLANALPPVDLDEATRQTAVTFLEDAARRIGGFKSLNELMRSGFFVDIGGYKVALRQKLLDPHVMSAAIALNETVNDNLRRLAEADTGADTLEAHLAEVDERIRSIFQQLRQDESAIQRDFDLWLKQGRRRTKKAVTSTGVVTVSTPARDRRVPLAIVAVLLAVITWLRWPSDGMESLPATELTRLSPLIVEGGIAPPGSPSVFIGQVDKGRWSVMTLEERRRAAQQFSLKLGERSLRAGTLMMEAVVVVQVENGQLLVVQ